MDFAIDKQLSGSGSWGDYANSDPIGDIVGVRSKLMAMCGKEPNCLVMSAAVLDRLEFHPVMLDLHEKRMDVPSIPNIRSVTRVLGMRIVLSESAGVDVYVMVSKSSKVDELMASRCIGRISTGIKI